jgi:hypothetical protein
LTDLLFIRPAEDSATAQVATWGQVLIQRLGSRTHTDLAGRAATREAVDAELSSGVGSLFHFGHGTEDTLVGNGGALVDTGNAATVPEAIVAIACESAVELGPRAVEEGVRSYLGFDETLGFPGKAPLPMGFAVSNGLSCLFISGHEIGCAAEQMRQGFEKARRDYQHQGAAYGLTDSEARTARVFMRSNFYSLKLLGDRTTTI